MIVVKYEDSHFQGQKPLIAGGCVCILGSFLFIQQLPVIAKLIRLGASSEMSNSTS